MVLATQNPIEQEGVYRLPEAQLDRFLFRVLVDYPTRKDEISMLDVHSHAIPAIQPICTAEEIRSIQQSVDQIYSGQEIQEYIIDLVRGSRSHPDLVLGASPRAAIYLLKASKVHAMLEGREFVTHADVQSQLLPVLGHRVILRPEAEMDGQSIQSILHRLVQGVPVVKAKV